MPLYGDLFLSEILKRNVLDQKGEILGRVRDVVVVKGETLPSIEALILEINRKYYRVHYKSLNIFNRKILTSTLTKEQLVSFEFDDNVLLAVRDILDKQIVDVNGAKVVRVNDIKMEGFHGRALFIAIDVGIRGILRRLGLEREGESFTRFFRIPLPYNLISWDYLQPLEPKLKAISLKMPQKMIEKMHPADIADIISSISIKEGVTFFRSLDIDSAAETLSELEPDTQVEILSRIDTQKAADIIE
ncbi:MgtE integral membrane protein, partial [Candidatus Magnetoovum chiemensis]